MRNTLLSFIAKQQTLFIILPLVISNTNFTTNVESVVRNEVSGENASVKTEVVNIVNQNETKVSTDKPGELKVEVKNGKVNIESSPNITPTITILEKNVFVETEDKIGKVRQQIFLIIENLFSRISAIFHLRP